MNLIIDIGNSSTKFAIFDGKEMVNTFKSREFSCEKLEKMLSPYKIEKAIISSVRDTPEYIFDLLTVNIPEVHILTHKSKLPFRIEYDTPETLGTDRIAAVAGAYNSFSGENILVIDAGTAITYDFLSGKSYKGGNISPGISMRFRALHKFTGKLPLVNTLQDFSFPGKNTTDAIVAGVITGVMYEINEYIRTFEKKHTEYKVIVTGGDSGYLKDKINTTVTYMPDIVMSGLNYILEYNAK
jgi:type III pantothenate kinase